MSQAIPAITVQANVPYEFNVPESPAPANYLIITNTGLVPLQWSTGQSSGYIPNGTTLAISAGGAGTVVIFTSTATIDIFITVWTINDGPVYVPQGSPITEINLAAGATVTADIAAGSIVDIGTIPDINLAAGTVVDIGTAPALEINNVAGGNINIQEIASGNQIGALSTSNNAISASAPTATVVGTTGTTSYNYQVVIFTNVGQSLPSEITQVGNGNATLSTTNYIALSANITVPSFLPGNLIYDTNLAIAMANSGGSWDFNGLIIGAANGEIAVVNPGSNSAEIVYTGDGTSPATYVYETVGTSLIPAATYTFSCPIDASNDTADASVELRWNLNQIPLATLTQPAGTKGVQSATFIAPSGISPAFPYVNVPGTSLPAGKTESWGPFNLTQTDAVQPYQPGPLWGIGFLRNGEMLNNTTTLSNGQLQLSTLLALNDTGQGTVELFPTNTVIDTTGTYPLIKDILDPTINDYIQPGYGNAATFFSGTGYPSGGPVPDYVELTSTSIAYVLAVASVPSIANVIYLSNFSADATLYFGIIRQSRRIGYLFTIPVSTTTLPLQIPIHIGMFSNDLLVVQTSTAINLNAAVSFSYIKSRTPTWTL